MTATAERIVLRSGTYRTTPAEQTWARIRPMLPLFTITRVADVTRLDEIGLPVHIAYRPTGRTLAVSMGIGLTPVQSRVTAAMESIEGWHMENPRLEIVARASAEELGLPYDPRSLHLAKRSPFTASTVVDWVAGRGLLTGRTYLAPYHLVFLDFTEPAYHWKNVLFWPTSSGVASGNTRAEATLHALHEIIERDCMAPYATSTMEERVYVDPESSTNPDTMAVLAAIRAVCSWVEVVDITSEVGVPCYGASIWDEALPMVFGGFGCHVDPDIALGRALAEAAQSRLCTISGARDDIDGQVYRRPDPSARRPVTPGTSRRPVRRPAAADLAADGDLTALVHYCAERVYARTGVEPFVVDLTHDDIGIPVNKVFTPGLVLMDDEALSRRPGGGYG